MKLLWRSVTSIKTQCYQNISIFISYHQRDESQFDCLKVHSLILLKFTSQNILQLTVHISKLQSFQTSSTNICSSKRVQSRNILILLFCSDTSFILRTIGAKKSHCVSGGWRFVFERLTCWLCTKKADKRDPHGWGQTFKRLMIVS